GAAGVACGKAGVVVPRLPPRVSRARRHPGDARGRSPAAHGRRTRLIRQPMAFKVVIPARLGSTRLPRKVLREIHGRPLIRYVWEAARRARADEVVIATDSG